ncbi:zinc carboxypeptidase family protein [Burkholderia sp. MSHR3999]|uniref:M14 family metallopeptidase n=1 Tax=Burkholderia sp. MSHR3999 TaxID=1542965 RepID=UPI0005B6E7DD|nr:M14 family metallopeptidase [Burkholderia sp. MSHR3999]KIP18984.1 zinc carboxypeptidase family protein [Burkholderia sp. MSHR3999]
MPYLNVTEVESALAAATAAPYDTFTQLIALPNLTWEGRQCHAIKIANGSGASRPGVYLLGGVHSREWGSPDILINFVEQLEQAYHGGMGLTFGSRTFSAADIKTIVDTLDIIVFPQANPDGRNYSMTVDAMWRKNRRTAAPNSAACTGVDVNRNYDFLWNYPEYFSPSAAIVDSTDPCDYQLYHGPSAFSEPESSNAKWIFDNFPNVGFFIDLHSYGQDILYSWGDDQDQTSDPTMNFHNPAYDGQRGVAGDAYKEYIPSDDLTTAVQLANTFRDGIQAVRGTAYTVKSAFDLYPTAGTSDDYAYSRHFTDGNTGKVISYTLEWGAEFHPPYSEMQNIIQEITCGLLAFCLSVRKRIEHCAFILNRNPIGQDEVDARRTTGDLPMQDAFRVVVDGFTAAELGLAGPGSTLNVASPVAGMTITCTGNTSDTGSYGTQIQRFTFDYSIDFPDDSAFGFAGATEDLTLNVTAGGVPASALLTLIKQPDPFLLHGDPAWLSIDLRVFAVRPHETWFGATMGADASAAPGFIQQVMHNLTAGKGTAGGQSFDDPAVLSPDEDKSKLYLQPNDEHNVPVFNFALAKVHYIGLIGASNVRVFFRLRQTQVTYAGFDYPPGGQYRRASSNPDGQPIALAGIQGNEYVTVPCFANGRIDSTTSSMDQQTDGHNIQSFTAIGGPEVDNFYGCWLDINQPDLRLPVEVPPQQDGPFDPGDPNPNFRPVSLKQALARNLHLCLIAEIDFDPTPIPLGKDPSNWDKLAQRNIAWSDVGSAQAVTTFEIRPTPMGLPAGQTPDELMIDWGSTPPGSTAQIYLPAVKAADVLAMATKMYTSHRLTRLDEHTLQCKTGGITYVPVPPGGNINYAGLLSVVVPEHLPHGNTYTVAVRQVTNAFGRRTPPPPPPPAITERRRTAVVEPAQIEWRRVVGAFQLTIPVKAKATLLKREERDYSVLLWIAEAIPHHNRWHPVFSRYLQRIAGRVSAFGGNPAHILPSPTGEGRHLPGKEGGPEARRAFTGKIAGLVFDCFGDFEGFLLDTEDGERRFSSREKDLAGLAERVWRERLRITVWAERDEPHRPLSIIVREPPAPLRRRL